MRCDGLPDPTNLPQLNAYRYRWLETSSNTECSTDRLLARAPELNQVVHDLDELLEHTHNIPPKQVELLNQVISNNSFFNNLFKLIFFYRYDLIYLSF